MTDLARKTVFTLAELADARGLTKGVTYRWLRNTGILIQVNTDAAGNPRWGTTLPLLIEHCPEIWDALAVALLASKRCPECGQPIM